MMLASILACLTVTLISYSMGSEYMRTKKQWINYTFVRMA